MIALFVTAAIYISALVIERQDALNQVSRYNVAWLVSQATTEYARLEQRIGAFAIPGSGVTEDEVQLRLDIVANRIKLLEHGEVEDLISQDDEYRSTVEGLRGSSMPRSRWSTRSPSLAVSRHCSTCCSR